MSADGAFRPKRGGNKRVTATTASQVVAIGAGERNVRILNEGSTTVFFVTFKASDGVRTASTTDTPVSISGGAGSVLIIEKPIDDDSLSYICASTTSVVNFQPGEGGC